MDKNNSPEAYIVSKSSSRDRFKPICFRGQVSQGGELAFGDPIYAGGGVAAIEAIPTSKVFPLSDCETCVSSCENQDFKKPPRQRQYGAQQQDHIIGEIEKAPGESTLNAAAFDDVQPQSTNPTNRLTYSPNDFSSYRQRFS